MIESQRQREAHWYLLQTKFNQEKRAAKELRQQNISVFLPMHKFEKIIKNNKVIKEEPLFSRYLFALLDIENTNWTSIRSTRGISNIVEFGNGPIVVSQNIVEELKKIDLFYMEPSIEIGQKVKVINGSLKGLNAIYQATDGSSRAYILLEFMQQRQYLSIDNNLIEKI